MRAKQIEIVTLVGTATTTLNWSQWETPEAAISGIEQQLQTKILHWWFV